MRAPFSRFQVAGSSMLPSYQAGDTVLVYRWGSIRPGDVVVFSHGGLTMVKRAVKKTNDRWYVRGDNLRESYDSEDFGDVPERNIIGKVVARI